MAKDQSVKNVSILTLGRRGVKAIPILIPKYRVMHNKMLCEVIRRRRELSEQLEVIPPKAPLAILMEGKSYVEFYKKNYHNMAFRFKVDEDMILT